MRAPRWLRSLRLARDVEPPPIADFEPAWVFLQDLEGWGVDHTVAGDPGGRTIWGISENNHPDMFRDGPPNEAQARAFYRRVYWYPLRLDELANQVVANELLEFAVHASTPEAGRANVAIRTAQMAVNVVREKSGAASVTADGIAGPETMGALNAMGVRTMATLAWHGRYNLLQLAYYLRLRRDLVQQFLRGWARRVVP